MTSGAQQSNPFSTGSGGANFETRIQAAFTLMLLTGRRVPILPPHPVHKLVLQGRHVGFHVDDFIAYARNPDDGREAKLLAQIKHQVSITVGDPVFAEVMEAAWLDFQHQDFDSAVDALALITGPLPATDVQNVRPLLEWARHSANAQEFLLKVASPGFSSDGKRSKLQVFKTHLKRLNGGVDVTDEHLWSFLSHFHLLGYDLDVDSGSTHALLLSLIGSTTDQSPLLLWGRLLDVVQQANQNAGTITVDTLPDDLRRAFERPNAEEWHRDLERLESHGRMILHGIRTEIGGVHLPQTAALAQMQAMAQDASFVWVTGVRGAGKSSLLRSLADQVGGDAHVFCLRTEDLNQPSLTQVFTSLGLTSSIDELSASLALLPKKYLLLESLEKVLELGYTGAFRDLLQFLKRQPGWTVVASGRNYAYQQVTATFLYDAGVAPALLELTGFDDEHVEQLCLTLEPLGRFARNATLRSLLNTPFFADLAYRAVQAGANFTEEDGEEAFRIAVWRDVIARESVRVGTLPSRRRATFIELAVQRARRMVYSVPESDFDAEAVARLEEDHLILRDERTRRLGLAHDVLEDWALEAFIEAAYQRHTADVQAFLTAVGNQPAMNRAFRLWLQRRLREQSETDALIVRVLQHPAIERYWQDEAIAVVLQSDHADAFMQRMAEPLLAGEGGLLQRFCFMLRLTCQTPRFDAVTRVDLEGARLQPLWLRPFGPGWAALITFALERAGTLPEATRSHLIEVLREWAAAWTVHEQLPAPGREVGLLTLHLLEPLKHAYRHDDVRAKLLDVLVRVAPLIPDEFSVLVEQDLLATRSRRERPRYVEDLLDKLFLLPGVATISRSHPDLLIQVAFQEWIEPSRAPDEEQRYRSYSEIEGDFGLQFETHRFSPASGDKGPFIHLLHQHGYKGVDFIVQLCNQTAERYTHSRLDQGQASLTSALFAVQPVEQIVLHLHDGTQVPQYVSERLWLGYRGHSVIPYLLQCALMALENWLVSLLERTQPIIEADRLEQLYDYILRHSNSVLITAVLASVSTGFPNRLGRAALPLLRHFKLYSLDTSRKVHERGVRDLNWFAHDHDPFGKLYADERRTAALRPWRQERLEELIIRLQLTEWRNQALAVIDELRAASTGSDHERFLLHRIDTRGWIPQVDEDEQRNAITFSTNVEPDLQQVQEQTQQEHQHLSRFSALLLWATHTFECKPMEHHWFGSWQEALTETQSLAREIATDDPVRVMHEGALVTVAAALLRDHLHNMAEEDARWCVGVVTGAVLRNADADDHWGDHLAGDLAGLRAAASVLPLTLDLALDDLARQEVQNTILVAVTHPQLAARVGAAEGIRLHLWSRDPAFAERCITASLAFAQHWHTRLTRERRAWRDQEAKSSEAQKRKTNRAFRETVLHDDVWTARPAIGIQSHSGHFIVLPALMIPDGSIQERHVHILTRLLVLLYEQAERDRRHDTDRHENEIPHSDIRVFEAYFADYLLNVQEDGFQAFQATLLHGCVAAPMFIHSLLLQVALKTERSARPQDYWRFWKMLAPRIQNIAIQHATAVDTYDYDRGHRTLIRGFVFADTPWQPIDYENQAVRFGRDALLSFVQHAGMNRDVFDGLSSLIYHFPQIFLKEGLVLLARWQDSEQAPSLVGNPAFYLEHALHRFLQIDQNEPMPDVMYGASLTLLTSLMNVASARAYYLREHLIRSRPPQLS